MSTGHPRGPQAPALSLPPCQRTCLDELIRRHQTPQGVAVRARIVLAAATGARNTQIAEQLGLDPKTVGLWRQRWAAAADRLRASEAEEGGADLRQVICSVLAEAPRSGCPATFSAEQLCHLMAVACETPEASGRPITHWTPREVAAEVVQRGLVPHISPRTVGRFLKGGGLKAPSVSLLAQ